MKTLLIILTTLFSICYSQLQCNVYLIEEGNMHNNRRNRETATYIDSTRIDLNSESVILYTEDQKEYYFYEELVMEWKDQYTYESKLRFIDNEQNIGILTYWLNSITNTRIVNIDYEDKYYRYYLR